MRILTLIFCFIALVATGLPLIDSAEWWIRIFDFPRIQISILILISIVLSFFYIDFKWVIKFPLLIILAIALAYQLHSVFVYTPLYNTEAKDSNRQTGENSFTLLVSNVRMENEDKESFHQMVKKVDPDVLLINEPNHHWAASISELGSDFPYTISFPLENTYGMMLLSKLPLTESSVNFLVQDDIPSIFTKITLHSGVKIDFYGVHPEPPKPGTDTYERDTELLIIGREIKESKNPTVVAGDLNDVGWSATSKLFRKYSKLVDPREGRGLYNTYSVFIPLFRYPLDHIFYSKEFGLLTLEKLDDIGSDHFPIFIGLNFEPDEDNTEDLDKADSEEKAEAEEKIGDGMQESKKD